MTAAIDMGLDAGGNPAALDLEELLATRLLVQGNSGSGKSHLLRRLLEGSAGYVQQIVIDPEGDFVSLADAFGHVAIDACEYSLAEIGRIAARTRAHRASVVLNLEGLEMEGQMRCVAAFLSALFDAPRDHWYPALVVVDEAQVFAPAAAGEVADDARRASLGAMTNLMCRGRKRGLAGVIATQRLAKLAKNVAAEASNFLMGRTFLDIDMARAADLLGMERRQAEAIRDLARGEFLRSAPQSRGARSRFGSARSGPRRGAAAPSSCRSRRTGGRDGRPALRPRRGRNAAPAAAAGSAFSGRADARDRRSGAGAGSARAGAWSGRAGGRDRRRSCRRRRRGRRAAAVRAVPGLPRPLPDARARFVRARSRRFLAPLGLCASGDRRCAGMGGGDFARRLASRRDACALLARRPRRAERRGMPADAELARLYGTSSTGRARSMLGFIEEKGLIVCRTDLSGRRTIALPHLGWTTAPSIADPSRPSRLARIDQRPPRERRSA
jgi:hypothetical protein